MSQFAVNLSSKTKQCPLSGHDVRDGLGQGQVAAWAGGALLEVFVSVFF